MDVTESPYVNPDFSTVFYFLYTLSVISLCLNTFLLIVIRNNNIFNEVESILYQILAVEDMLIYAYSVSIVLVQQEAFHGNSNPVMAIAEYFQYSFIYQNLGTILLITTSRYLMIVKPFKFSRWLTKRRIIIAQVVISFCSFFSIGVWVLLQALKISPNFYRAHMTTVLTAPIIAGCIVGLVTCFHILYISIQQSRRINALRNIIARNNPNQDLNVLQERRPLNSFKGIRTVLVISMSYWIAWIPFVLRILSSAGHMSLPKWFRDFALVMLMCNSCWNLLLYYVTNRMFRKAVNKTIRAMKRRLLRIIQ